MSNQYLKLRRSAIPGKIPETSSIDFGEIALNTYDGQLFLKKSGSQGEIVIVVGSTGSFTGSFIGDGAGLTNIPASGITGLNLSRIATGSITASVSNTDISASFRLTSGSNTLFNVTKDGFVWIGNGSFVNQGYPLSVQGSGLISDFKIGFNGNANESNVHHITKNVATTIALTNISSGGSSALWVGTNASPISRVMVVGNGDIWMLPGTGVIVGGTTYAGFRHDVQGTGRYTNNLTVTGSVTATTGFTGSLFGTASWANNAITASSADNFTVRGTLTAQTIVAQTITSSTNFVTGSTRFGSLQSNTHQFTGSVSMTGSLSVSGSLDSFDLKTKNVNVIIGSSYGYGVTNGSAIDGLVQITTDSNKTQMWFRPPENPANYNSAYWSRIEHQYGNLKILGSNYGSLELSTNLGGSNSGKIIFTGAVGTGIESVKISGPENAGRIALTTYQSSPITLNGGNILIGLTVDEGFKLNVSGSTKLNGNTQITGSLIVTQGITGSLFGTSSWAQNAITASYISASNIAGLSLSQISLGVVTASINSGTNIFNIVSGSNTLVVVDGTGSMGIGTTSPTAKLDVIGAAKLGGGTVIGRSSTGVQSLKVVASSGGSSNAFTVTDESQASTWFSINGANGDCSITSAIISNSIIINSQNIFVRIDTPSQVSANFTVKAGSQNFQNRAGGNLFLQGGASAGAGDGVSGFISFGTTDSTAALGVTNTISEVARFTINKSMLIGTTTEVTSSILTLASTTKGFLSPRTNSTASITSPVQGLLTYITSSGEVEGLWQYRTGSGGWVQFLHNSSSIPASSITGLNLSRIATGSVTASVNTGTNIFNIVSGSNTLVVVNNNGNVGIRTPTLGSNLPNAWSGTGSFIEVTGISSESSGIFLRRGSFTGIGLDMWSRNDAGVSFIDNRYDSAGAFSAVNIRVRTSGTPRTVAIFDDEVGAKLGDWTNNRTNALRVDGDMSFRSGGGVRTITGPINASLIINAIPSLPAEGVVLQYNSTSSFLLNNSGNVIIKNGGTFVDAGYRLDVVGTARVSGNTTITSGDLNLSAIPTTSTTSNLRIGTGYSIFGQSYGSGGYEMYIAGGGAGGTEYAGGFALNFGNTTNKILRIETNGISTTQKLLLGTYAQFEGGIGYNFRSYFSAPNVGFSFADGGGVQFVLRGSTTNTNFVTIFTNGNVSIAGSLTVIQGITGSLFGTSSWAQNAVTSSYILNAVSASFAATASSADNFTVRGTLTAQTIVAQTITSSTDFVTGSTRFGSLQSNTHQFTGSVSMTGSLDVNGTARVQSSLEIVSAAGLTFGGGVTALSYLGGILEIGKASGWSDVRMFTGGVFKYGQTSALTTITNTTINLSTTTVQLAGVNALTYSGTDLRFGSVAAGFNTLSFHVAGSEKARITSAGRLLLGRTSEDTFLLDVSGSARISGEANIQGLTAGTGNNSPLGNLNTAFGYQAGFSNTSTPGGYVNSFFGYQAGRLVSTGYGNSFFGYNAGVTITTGIYNTAIGTNSMYSAPSTVNNNVAVGYATLGQSSGSNNVCIGSDAGRAVDSSNVYIGYQSGYLTANGTGNIAIGSRSGQYTGNNKLYIATEAVSNGNLIYGDFSTGQLKINNTNTPSLNASAQFEVVSTTRGFLLPRMTAEQRVAISSPAQGLLVYDTGSATEGLWLYNSGSTPGWQEVLTNTGSQSILGGLTATSFTGSLFGTSSWATNAITASYVSASNIAGLSLSQISLGVVTASINSGTNIFNIISGSNTLVVVDNTGSVGIGTTSPGYKLDVNGTARVSGLLTLGLGISGPSTTYFDGPSTTGDLLIRYTNVSLPITTTTQLQSTCFRATSNSSFTTGAGIEIAYTSNIGYIYAYDRGTGSGKPLTLNAFGGNVIIGGATDIASAQFHITSTTKGFLPPRMTTTQKNAIGTPAQGLHVYDIDTSTEGIWYYSSGSIKAWTRVLNDTGSQSITGSLSINGSLAINNTQFNNTSSLTSAGITTVSQLSTSSYTSCFYNYTVASASNARSGQVMTVWNGSTIAYTEVVTTDIGNTSQVIVSSSLSSGFVRLQVSASAGWTFKNISNLL